MAKMSDSIQVAIKVRPLIKREKDENLQTQWAVVDNTIVPTDLGKRRGDQVFQFDHIFDPEKDNADVFNTVVKPIVNAAINGFNGTVFAYGQTSSGKTYTMLGTPHEPGIIVMAVEHMFDSIAETCNREFLLRVSYLEIYNEKVNDLLDPLNQDLKLREDSNGYVQVLNSKEEVASTPESILTVMKRGDKNRSIGQTDMNEKSSRSHSIFRITIESRDQSSDSDGAVQVSQLNLVDLAGSERAGQTNATGDRFKEGTHINMSLSTLGLVIKQLSESGEAGPKYVNFRDSKLTRLLQASLGGNAMTAIICAVTPAVFEETQCTLGFAQRAKSVKNKPQVNEVLSDAALLKRYKKQLSKLNDELEKLKSEDKFQTVQEMESELQEKENKLQETDRLNQLLKERIHLLKTSIICGESATKDNFITKLPKSKRRRTWAGDRGTSSRMSLNVKLTALPTITEMPSSPESNCKMRHTKGRKSIIQTIDLNNESFETAFTDFELELIKNQREHNEENDYSLDSYGDKTLSRINLRSGSRVKFLDEVEVHRLSNSSTWSEISTPKKDEKTTSLPGSPDTPKSVLRDRLDYLSDEFKELQEFTTLERQFFSAQLEDQISVSLNCIYGLSSRNPDIMEAWKPSLFNNARSEANTLAELKRLEILLEDFKVKEIEKEKETTNKYNECLRELGEVRCQKDALFAENAELKKKLEAECEARKKSDALIVSLRKDTDDLMGNVIQKNAELNKLKDKIQELELSYEINQKKSLNISLKIDNDESEKKDTEIEKLKEILEDKIAQITKYQQSEEKMNLEHEQIQNSLKAQVDLLSNNKDKVEVEVSKLSKIIEEQESCIANHLKTEIELKSKVEELKEFLKAVQESSDNKLYETKIEMYKQNEQTLQKELEELQKSILDKENYIESKNAQVCNEKDIEITKLQRIIDEKSVEISKYIQDEENSKKEIAHLQICLQNMNNISNVSKDCQTEAEVYEQCNESQSKFNQVEDNSISQLEQLVKEKLNEINQYRSSEKELKMEIEQLQQALSKINGKFDELSQSSHTEYLDINVDQLKMNKENKNETVLELEIIEEKNLEIEKLKESEERMKNEVDKLKNELAKLVEVESRNEEILRQYTLLQNTCDIETNKEKDSRIAEMMEIINEKDSELARFKNSLEEAKTEILQLQECIKTAREESAKSQEILNPAVMESNSLELMCYQESKEELKKELEALQQNLEMATKKEIQLKEFHNSEILSQELRSNEKIKIYEDQIDSLMQQKENLSSLENKILLLNDELLNKSKKIEELNKLNENLENRIKERSNQMFIIEQNLKLKIQKLEQKILALTKDRNQLKDKIEPPIASPVSQVQHIEDVNYFSNQMNDTVPTTPTKLGFDSSLDNSMKSLVLRMESSIQPELLSNKESSTELIDNFAKPAVAPLKNPSESQKASNSNAQAEATAIKKFESESSSIFDNMSYFDNMEVSGAITEDCTATFGMELTGNIDASMLKKESIADETLKDCMNAEENQSKIETQEISYIKDESKVINETLENGSFSLEKSEKLRSELEKENVRLRFDIQNKIQEAEDVKKEICAFKKSLEDLEQTICKMTSENLDMSNQLTEERENKIKLLNDFSAKKEQLTAEISALREENNTLNNDLAIVSEQMDILRSKTPVITDEDLKLKFYEYEEKIKNLNEENINLSEDVMDKITELEKLKGSKMQEYDHDCTYKDQSEKLNERVQILEKENIDLSNDLSDQIEECDKLKENADLLKKQLDALMDNSCHSSDDLEHYKQENKRLNNEIISLRSEMIQLRKENENFSVLALNSTDLFNESSSSCHQTSIRAPSTSFEVPSVEEKCTGDETNVSSLREKVVSLTEQVLHLTKLNQKLSSLKLTTCSQCAHLKELNESRRQLKLEVKCSNQKLLELQKKFEQKCAEVEVLKTRANEDINTSLSLLETSLNSSSLDGGNVSIMEEKVQHLFEELAKTKDNHTKLTSQYNEKCTELQKLQAENISPNSPAVEKKRSKSDARKNSTRIQAIQKDLETLRNDLHDLKQSNANIDIDLRKIKEEKNEWTEEIESLKLANEELKKECNAVKNTTHSYEEKAKLLEDELTALYKQVEIANAKEIEIQAQKLEIEIKYESMLKEKTQLHEKCKKDLDEYNVRVLSYEKENASLKNDIKNLEDAVQNFKGNNQSYIEDKLQEEVDAAKHRMINEIKSMNSVLKDELSLLSKKSVTDIFTVFVKCIFSKEKELMKRIQHDFEKTKQRLVEEKNQSDDAEKRANLWAKTLETDLEKLQNDYSKLEKKLHYNNKTEERLKEVQHENNQLVSTVNNLEQEIHSLHAELDKKLKVDHNKDAVILAVQEKERIAKSKEEELESRLQYEKDKYVQEIDYLQSLLNDYKSTNNELKTTVEGQDFQIEHLKNTIDSKSNDYTLLLKQVETLQQEILDIEEFVHQLKLENMEKSKNVEETNSLLKIKCDLLTEYKTKVEAWEPERDNMQGQLSDKKMIIEKYKEDIHNLKVEHQKQIVTLQDKLSDEEVNMSKLNKQLAELKTKNINMSSTIEDFKDKCSELERENASLQRKIRNSTSKIKVETEMQVLLDENRSLKNNLEGAYNRIKELQEDKVHVQHKLSDTQIEKESLEHELEKIKKNEQILRDKLSNLNLQKLREANELLLREKNEVVREVEEKRMLIASNNQKIVEYGIENDTLKKQKDTLNAEKNALENRIAKLVEDSEILQKKIATFGAEKDMAYKQIVEERNSLVKKMDELKKKNGELDEEMEDLVNHIHKQENEIAELQDQLITGGHDGNLDKLREIEEENEKLKIDLRVNEVSTTKLQNEIVRLNTDKEFLQSRIEDLNGKIGELELKSASRGSSKSNSPTSHKHRRRSRRSFIFNQNRNIDSENCDSRELTDTDSPTPPLISSIDEECQKCYDLRNKIREMSLILVERNNKITLLEVQLQAENFPYQMKCNELKESLSAAQTKNSQLQNEIRKLQRALMKDSSRECHLCRQRSNKRDQSVQVLPESFLSMTGVSSGIIEDQLKIQKLEKERNLMKDLCRNRSRKIKELEQQIRELENSKTSS